MDDEGRLAFSAPLIPRTLDGKLNAAELLFAYLLLVAICLPLSDMGSLYELCM